MATLPPGYKPREGLMPSVNKPNLRPSFGGKPPVGPGVLGTLHDDLNQWWANWGARVTGLVVVVLYSLALVWVGFSAGTAVTDGCNGAKGPDSPWANLPIELAESHPEAAKFLTRKDKNGFQCNFELATHKLRVHHIKSLDAKAKMDGTPPQDKGRYLGFKAKYEKALIDERGYHECVQELMPDVLYSFQKDLEAHRLPSKAQVAKDEAAISELMKNVQNSGRSMSDDEKYAESLHRQIAKGHAFDPFPELKQKTGREQFTAFNSDGQ